MTVVARLRYLRIAPRKVRIVANLIKRMSLNEAEAQLLVNARKPALPILKLLKSALENAKNAKMDEKKLFIKEIRVDGGPVLKRWMPRAQGRSSSIHKNTSHITIILGEKDKELKARFMTDIKKPKKEKKESAHKHEHAHDHSHAETERKTKIDVEKEKDIEKKMETKKESTTKDKGFAKRIFRRKSV